MAQVSESPEESADQGGTRGNKRASRGVPGCILKPAIVAVVALAGGTYLITSARFGAGARAGGIVLIFVGAIAALPALAILFGMGVSWYFGRKLRGALDGVAGMGREMVRRNKAIWVERHEYRDATEADFAPVDRGWYDGLTRELQAAGYRHLGDVVNATIERISNVRPPIRVMVSPDGTTVVGLHHLIFKTKEARSVDVESEFSDGSFLITSNTEDVDMTTTPPMIRRQRNPADTPPADLLRMHESAKVSRLAGESGLSCAVVSTVAEAMEFQHRQQAIKAAFRTGIGYVDPEEVRRIAARSVPDDEATQNAAVLSAELARREAIAEERKATDA